MLKSKPKSILSPDHIISQTPYPRTHFRPCLEGTLESVWLQDRTFYAPPRNIEGYSISVCHESTCQSAPFVTHQTTCVLWWLCSCDLPPPPLNPQASSKTGKYLGPKQGCSPLSTVKRVHVLPHVSTILESQGLFP